MCCDQCCSSSQEQYAERWVITCDLTYKKPTKLPANVTVTVTATAAAWNLTSILEIQNCSSFLADAEVEPNFQNL